MKKRYILYIVIAVSLVLAGAFAGLMALAGAFDNYGAGFSFNQFISFLIFFAVTFFALSSIIISVRYTSGKLQEVLFVLFALLDISVIFSYLIYAVIDCGFEVMIIDWIGALVHMPSSWIYFLVFGLVYIVLFLLYVFVINKGFLSVFGKNNGELKQIKGSNLENSHWMTLKEKEKLFKKYMFSDLGNVEKDGIPVVAKLNHKEKDMVVAFNPPCHSIIIGSTGSGKTTTFVTPMIQILASTKAGSSMVITDPKGELFQMHSKFLKERGYDVKVIDLRDTYSSYRWNPLDAIWDNFSDYMHAHEKAFKRDDDILESGLKLDQPVEDSLDIEEWYEFEGKAFLDYQRLINAVKVYKKKIYDEVYEDLNDLVTVLIPVENEKDPLWEKGARSITLAVLLAMLEDAQLPNSTMNKGKFNFFNLAKILQNSNNDYQDLRDYFKGRSSLSRAYSLSKQVCDAAQSTRASYMSIVYDKLTLFNDAGVCALTSSSDFTAGALADHPTALFLKIPDEKDTRHNLAAIFILNIYKTLIKVASTTPELSLPRNVYFIMDEFGNMPKISKFDKFITVGRSRKIWFQMIIQSYAQLNNVYGDNVADIIKGNCGIKMFIGSNDMQTCKEYSELCGNITIASTSSSGTAHSETSYSTSYQTRPLIYPSELQRLNKPGDIGHSIIVTFGNYPLKTYFTPSFKVPLYKFGEMDQSELEDRLFNEQEAFYDIRLRNKELLEKTEEKAAEKETTKKKSTTKKASILESFTQAELLEEFLKYQQSNPGMTFKEFCERVAKGDIEITREAKK
ncbi:MAG: DEAD/DEAH box helicase [Erysipelotrichaceae bacterium]|nr:DEAD/DEAH box helicase [Erysipelotrichaceae bacterium]